LHMGRHTHDAIVYPQPKGAEQLQHDCLAGLCIIDAGWRR